MPVGALQALDKTEFLEQYWQQRHLFLPGALPHFQSPVCEHELAGLALEEQVESRIVSGAAGEWQVEYGPFTQNRLQRDGVWSLLVQAVDHYVDDVARLRELVDFIPQWRIDDVMISYGTDGSSVGPHYDNYDVFLLQGEGEKLWRVGQACDENSELLPHPELRILANFECCQEYLLRTGDLLYIPPGVAHWGIAQGNSMTYSIGFRAPRINDMLSRWVDDCLARMPQEQFFSDAGRPRVNAQGEISLQDRQRAEHLLRDAIEQQLTAGRWFGELVTEPRYEPSPSEEVAEVVTDGAVLRLNPAAKLAWQQDDQSQALNTQPFDTQSYTVFANGQSLPLERLELPLLRKLCSSGQLAGTEFGRLHNTLSGRALLSFLLQMDCVYIEG